MQIYKYTIMKTMYLPGYHHNGFVAAHDLRHMIIYIWKLGLILKLGLLTAYLVRNIFIEKVYRKSALRTTELVPYLFLVLSTYLYITIF